MSHSQANPRKAPFSAEASLNIVMDFLSNTAPDKVEAAANRLPDRAPPLFVSVGGAESPELRRQSADYLHAWKAAGLRGWSFEQPEANHFMPIAGFIDKESKLCASLRRLVETSEGG
jgi:acetyl esterase/lipase